MLGLSFWWGKSHTGDKQGSKDRSALKLLVEVPLTSHWPVLGYTPTPKPITGERGMEDGQSDLTPALPKPGKGGGSWLTPAGSAVLYLYLLDGFL